MSFICCHLENKTVEEHKQFRRKGNNLRETLRYDSPEKQSSMGPGMKDKNRDQTLLSLLEIWVLESTVVQDRLYVSLNSEQQLERSDKWEYSWPLFSRNGRKQQFVS